MEFVDWLLYALSPSPPFSIGGWGRVGHIVSPLPICTFVQPYVVSFRTKMISVHYFLKITVLDTHVYTHEYNQALCFYSIFYFNLIVSLFQLGLCFCLIGVHIQSYAGESNEI